VCLNEAYRKIRIGEHLSFFLSRWSKTRNCFIAIVFNFASEYAIRNVQRNQVGQKLNGAHQLLVYVDDVHLLGDTIDTMKKNTETVIGASKKVGLEMNGEKTK
jgi:hypothetical protein